MTRSRFEIVQTDAGYHGRWTAANNESVWSTEVHEERRSTIGAIVSLAQQFSPVHSARVVALEGGGVAVEIALARTADTAPNWVVPVVDVDERTGSDA
jgi:uncharacterized protein YegP (UPF0339 family)